MPAPAKAEPTITGGRGQAAKAIRPVLHPDMRQYAMDSVSAWGGATTAFERHGDIGYLAAGQRLVVLDTSVLNDPRELGSVNLGSQVMDLKARDGLVYVVTRSVNSSLSTAQYTPEGTPHLSGFHVVDVSDPASPVRIWSNDDSAGHMYLGTEIDLYGNYAFLRDRVDGTWCADLTDPRHPVLKRPDQAVRFRNAAGTSIQLNDLEIRGDLAYAATRDSLNQFKVYDLSTITPGVWPIEPRLVGSTSFFLDRETQRVVIEGNSAYVLVKDQFIPAEGVDPLGQVIWAVDITNPASPTRRGRYAGFPLTPSGQIKDIYGIAVSAGRLYAADGAAGPAAASWDQASGVSIFDVASNPDQPALIGSYKTHGSVRGVVAEGTTAYLLDLGEGLVVMDATDAARPVRLGNYHSPAELGTVKSDGNYLYVADAWNGFSILDVSDITSPKLVGVHQTPERTGLGVSDLDVRDGVVYLAAGRAGLEAIDVSSPANPVLQGAIRFPSEDWYTLALTVDALAGLPSRVVYISVVVPPGQYLFSIDATNPGVLSQIDQSPLQLPGVTKFARHAPGRFYATLQFGGPVDINGSVPGNLRMADLTGSTSWTTSIGYKPDEGLLCVTGQDGQADEDDRLYVLDMQSSPAGIRIGTTVMKQINDIADHRLGMIALGRETSRSLSEVMLVDVSDPTKPAIAAGATVSFQPGMSLDSHLCTRGMGVFVTSEHSVGLESFRLRLAADRNGDGTVDTLDILTALRSDGLTSVSQKQTSPTHPNVKD